MLKVLSILVYFANCNAVYVVQQGYIQKPAVLVKKVAEPSYEDSASYNFGYESYDNDGNVQTHKEEGDAEGRKFGSYSFRLSDGRQRTVEYVADSNGFRPIVKSNEQGTDFTQEPASVKTYPVGVTRENTPNVDEIQPPETYKYDYRYYNYDEPRGAIYWRRTYPRINSKNYFESVHHGQRHYYSTPFSYYQYYH